VGAHRQDCLVDGVEFFRELGLTQGTLEALQKRGK